MSTLTAADAPRIRKEVLIKRKRVHFDAQHDGPREMAHSWAFELNDQGLPTYKYVGTSDIVYYNDKLEMLSRRRYFYVINNDRNTLRIFTNSKI